MSKEKKWFDGIATEHGVIGDTPLLGIEIVCRLIIKDQRGHEEVAEVIEKCREVGAAEITKQVAL